MRATLTSGKNPSMGFGRQTMRVGVAELEQVLGAGARILFWRAGLQRRFSDSQKIVVRVTDPSANAAVAAQLTSLGRRIGREWAKQDDCAR